MTVTGRRINTVNIVAKKMEMVMWDHFAASHQNILVLNPQVFQLIQSKKFDRTVKLFSCI